MIHFGSSAEWVNLIDSQVPDILGLVIASWSRFRPQPQTSLKTASPTGSAPECRTPRIGRRFYFIFNRRTSSSNLALELNWGVLTSHLSHSCHRTESTFV